MAGHRVAKNLRPRPWRCSRRDTAGGMWSIRRERTAASRKTIPQTTAAGFALEPYRSKVAAPVTSQAFRLADMLTDTSEGTSGFHFIGSRTCLLANSPGNRSRL